MNQYPDLATVIYDVCQQWCQQHGYSDLFCRNGEWWAFLPNGVIPLRDKTVAEVPSVFLKDTASHKVIVEGAS